MLGSLLALHDTSVLWSDAAALEHGQANHAVTITGIARDPYDGAQLGFYINDSGTGQSGQFVSPHLMTTAFEHEGGFCVVTDRAQEARAKRPSRRLPVRVGGRPDPNSSDLCK